VLFWFAVFAAALTAIYMFRLLMLVFYGGFKGTHEQEHHLHESPLAMTIPLIVLAILSAVGGFVQLPEAFGGHHYFNDFLSPVVPAEVPEGAGVATKEYYLLGGTAVGLIIIALVTYKLFAVKKFTGVYTGFKKILADKWYIDELYNSIIVKPLNSIAGFLNTVIDKSIIDGIVNGTGRFVNYSARQLRLLQSGQVGNYILFMVLSITVLFLVFWNQEIILAFLQKIF
jgi:NADH-quinone oxidoreductase subunit L